MRRLKVNTAVYANLQGDLTVVNGAMVMPTQELRETYQGPIDPLPVDPELTVEEAIAGLPPLWLAALEAYIEQQPRDRRAIINNIKRHLK